MEDINLWLPGIAIIISIVAILISVFSWHKSRAIYDIKKFKFPKRVGDSKTEEDKKHEVALREELETGNWQILHIYENNDPRNQGSELMIVIGRNKK